MKLIYEDPKGKKWVVDSKDLDMDKKVKMLVKKHCVLKEVISR